MRRMAFIILGVLVLVVAVVAYLGRPAVSGGMTFGVSFAPRQARTFGLEPNEVYRALLDDLGVRQFRLAAYWDEIEPQQGEFRFSELDQLLDEANKRDAKVLLAVGQKLPRWPECFYPDWVPPLSQHDKEEALLRMLETVVTRYDRHPAVEAWQLENEPFVGWFGACPKPSPALLRREEAVLRRHSQKPILMTDSGELSLWRRAVTFGDRFGTTMYRATWNPRLGYTYTPWPAWSYRAKARLWRLDPRDVIVAELQAEPWPPGTSIHEVSIEEQYRTMRPERFVVMVDLAKRTGFSEAYLWGAEWWYWLKEQGKPEMWEAARQQFRR